MKRRVGVGLFVVVLASALVTAALLAGGGAAQPAATSVKITMKEWKFTASRAAVPAGKVTFVVSNTGTMEHEFVVMRTNLAPRKLPMEGQQAKEIGFKGEIEEFHSGLTKRLTLTLKPGRYVLLCNVPGHYKRGQAVRLVVGPAT